MKLKTAFLPALALALALSVLTPPARAQGVAGAPAFIDYQGMVFDGNITDKPLGSSGTSPNYTADPTNYTMQFKIYSAQSGGTLIWAETQTVTVSLGAFAVRLGSGASIPGLSPAPTQTSIGTAFNGKDRYLELTVIVPPASTGTLITPRLAFQSSPFSFVAQRAKLADEVNGKVIADSTSTFAGGTFTGGTFGSIANPATFVGNGAGLASLDASNISAGTLGDAHLSSNVALLNRTPQAFTGATNSFSGNVGIGTTAPSTKLDVAGTITAALMKVKSQSGEWDVYATTGTNGGFYIYDRIGLNYAFSALQNGNVGIGTTVPTEKLDVAGNIKVSGNIIENGQHVPSAEEDLRIVRGLMLNDGEAWAGSGWSAVKTSTGTFKITLTTAFSGVPAVTANTWNQSVGAYSFVTILAPITTNSFIIETRGQPGNLQDRSISFIAIGPR